MALTKLTATLEAVQDLPKEPTISYTALQAVFDEDVNTVKDFINDTLTVEIDTAISSIEGDLSDLTSNVLQLDNTTSFTPDADYEPATKKYVDDTAIAGVGDNSVTNTKLGSDVKIGSLALLDTSDKSSVVDAINELYDGLADKAEDDEVVKLSGAQTIDDVKTFTSIPVAPASNPTTDNQLARKAYVDTKATETTYTDTLDSASWSGSSAPWSQAVTVTGITASDAPILDITMSGTYATDEIRNTQWGYIYRAVTSTNTITFYASTEPDVDLPFQAKVVS